MKIYFVGIGGIGMSALARYFKTKGDEVFGYDHTRSPLCEELEKEGMSINYEDTIDNIPSNIDLCVYTPAIPESSNQIQYFKQNNIPLKKRAEVLGEIVKDKKVLAVAGTHGKTTTCGMIAHILTNAPCKCSAFLGGILKNIGSNFIYDTHSDYVVVEADEYDRSFLQLHPYVSVITSIQADHLDIYHTFENLYHTFEKYVNQTQSNGMLLRKQDVGKDFHIGDIQHRSYSLCSMETDYYMWNLRISNGSYYFDYKHEDGVWYDMQMTYPGQHNIENAIAALSVCDYVLKQEGVSLKQREEILRQGLRTFQGMWRRLDFQIKNKQRIFIDDYAHHPQEILTTIQSLRELYPKERLTGIFQPHLYTRTRDFADEFAKSLENLDEVILLPIYPAREEPIPGVDSHLLLHKINKMDKYLVTKEQLFPLLEALDPKFLITFGAGDIADLVPKIKDLLLN
jgi:UDP-N-acetylmuramate--alanine ligase